MQIPTVAGEKEEEESNHNLVDPSTLNVCLGSVYYWGRKPTCETFGPAVPSSNGPSTYRLKMRPSTTKPISQQSYKIILAWQWQSAAAQTE